MKKSPLSAAQAYPILFQAWKDSATTYLKSDYVGESVDASVTFFSDESDPKTLRVAFRGTVDTNIKDLLNDGDILPVLWEDIIVHQGFAASVDALWKAIKAKVAAVQPTTIIFEGHSRGASIGLLAAWRFRKEYSGLGIKSVVAVLEPARCVAWSSLDDFNKVFYGKDPLSVIWTRNDQDIITHIPLLFGGYGHVDGKFQLGNKANWLTAFGGKKWAHMIPSLIRSLRKLIGSSDLSDVQPLLIELAKLK